jgi:hypothetical protein
MQRRCRHHGRCYALADEAVRGIDRRVAMIEQSVFGQSYTNRPLADRVSRLEKKMIPSQHHWGNNGLPPESIISGQSSMSRTLSRIL